ncbi:MAG TPA: glutaminyl-peptide cyclotransferase [Chitinophagaceae bacterium]|jgi:glutamine cyclotransferase|nr:glutaminyl-peptide cyclotransferase [Chitinophagaceae bacterium]
MKRKIFLPLIAVSLISSFTFLFVCCKPKDPVTTTEQPGENQTPPPPVLGHTIIQVYPHDTSFYTQGLTFYKGELYEGTGDPGYVGQSRLMKIDLKTGKALKKISLSDKYFGEGITILRDSVYQLTWQEHKVFVYTLKDFKLVKEYDITGEGWGITNDGQRLIVSTGNGILYYYDPSTFRLLSKSSIMEGNNQTFNLNELEYIDGFVYANQYQYPYILKIDPAAGRVVAKYDVNDMWNRVKAIDPTVDVPNGIAYDSTTKKIFVTGKYWPEMYEIQLGQ